MKQLSASWWFIYFHCYIVSFFRTILYTLHLFKTFPFTVHFISFETTIFTSRLWTSIFRWYHMYIAIATEGILWNLKAFWLWLDWKALMWWGLYSLKCMYCIYLVNQLSFDVELFGFFFTVPTRNAHEMLCFSTAKCMSGPHELNELNYSPMMCTMWLMWIYWPFIILLYIWI